MLFDTHLHLIYPDILKYPWLDKVDSLNKPSHYEDYHIKASRLGISACLHMEVDVEENQIKEETKMIHNLIENNDTIIKGVISSCRPEQNNFQDMIEYADTQKLIKGFRRVLHVITCEHKSRRVTRTEHNGSITIVADSFNNKKLNSPNDVVVKSDGSIWFTDPTYGIISDYEGIKSISEQEGCFVYRIDRDLKNISIVATDFIKPNGLAFNHDETSLFISDTGLSHMKNGPKHIRKIKVNSDGSSLGESKVFAECNAGLFDGFRFDTEDRLWTSAADGVHCFSKDGKLIGKIHIPEMVANVCFGGSSLNRLFIAGTTSIYSAYLAVNGRSCIV